MITEVSEPDRKFKSLTELQAERGCLQRIKDIDHGWYQQFTERFLEYGEGAADELGLAGQWGDLHRKVAKLKRELWCGDDRVQTRESAREVLLDIIGHAFLAIDMIDRGMTGGH
jgi:hypothetical protein